MDSCMSDQMYYFYIIITHKLQLLMSCLIKLKKPTKKKTKKNLADLHNVRRGLTQSLIVTLAVGLMEVTLPWRSGASSLNPKKRFICKSPSTYHSLLVP